MMDFDYEHVRASQAERVSRSLARYGTPRSAAPGCPLERLVKWIAARRHAKLDPAALAR